MTPEACGRSVVGLFYFIPLNALVMPQKTCLRGEAPQQPTKNPEFPKKSVMMDVSSEVEMTCQKDEPFVN